MALRFDSCRCISAQMLTRATEGLNNSASESEYHYANFAFNHSKKRKKKRKRDRPYRHGSHKHKKRKRLRGENPLRSFLLADVQRFRMLKRMPSYMSEDSDDLEEPTVSAKAKDFWQAYSDNIEERFFNLSKYQLVQEFLALEERIVTLEKEYESVKKEDKSRIREPSPASDDVDTPGEVRINAETAVKIEVFSEEIKKLEYDNETLYLEKMTMSCMMCGLCCGSPYGTDYSDDAMDVMNPVAAGSSSKKYSSFESNTDSGMASLEGNTSSSSEELKEESRYYQCDKSPKGFVSSTTL